jgi:putative transposase
MRYEFISNNHDEYEVNEMCEALGIKHSSYYAWKNRGLSLRREKDVLIKEQIAEVYKKAKGRYGHRPIYHHLKDEDIACGRDRTLRLMNEMGLEGVQEKRFKPLGTDSNHLFGYSANLLKELGTPTEVNQVWVSDTTYLLTESGWRYLATVMDLFSRRVIGWSVSASNDTDLVCSALKAAVMTRGKLCGNVIHHSDRGSTYASDRYQKLIKSLLMQQSMSAKGNCYDNAAMESFFGRYKSSSVRDYVFADENELRANVFEYIEVFYNRFRKHSSLGYKSPVQFEGKFLTPMGVNEKASCFLNN